MKTLKTKKWGKEFKQTGFILSEIEPNSKKIKLEENDEQTYLLLN